VTSAGVNPRQRWWVLAGEIVTVGIPFCAFKLLTGAIALGSPAAGLGYVLVGLGAIDLVLNTINLVTLLTMRRRVSAVCLTEVVLAGGRGDASLGLAIDVFVSFGLVAVVVGASLLSRLSPWQLMVWNIAVVLNVLGAGIARLLGAVRGPRNPAPS